MRLPERQDINNGLSELSIKYTPVAPHIFLALYERTHTRPPEVISLDQARTLCDELSTVYPDTQTWQHAKGFFNAWQFGADVVISYLGEIGFSFDRGRIMLSSDWKDHPLPVEFMDLPWVLPDGTKTHVRELAKLAALSSWNGYQYVKEMLHPPGAKPESPSLLVSPVIKKAKDISKKSGNSNILVLGMSEDEVYGFENNGYTVVGLAASYSPKIETLIRAGRVHELSVVRNQKIDPDKLPKGQCYMIKGDVRHGIPFVDGNTVVMGSYFMHHIPCEYQLEVIKDIARVSSSVGKNGKAFVLGEASNAFPLVKMQVSLNPMITAWDAIASVAKGLNTIEHLKESHIPMNFTETPLLDPSGPLARLVIPATNTLITG